MSMSPNAADNPLFQPFAFKHLKLPNRVVMSPMTRQRSPGGIPDRDVAAYYRQRAEGGVGLIITEGTYVDHPAANGYTNVPAFHGEAALAGWARVVEQVHAAGARIIPQLWHVGPTRRPGMEPDPAVPGYGPVAIQERGSPAVKRMSRTDIRDVVAAFAQGALDAERIGFDGVEIHGAHEYLIDSFLWSVTNGRDDEYAGPIENRARFALEVVEAVRAAVSPDFPVLFRFSQWKMRDYGARIVETPEELGRLLPLLAAAGVDIFDASARRFWEPAFEGSPLSLAAWTKRLTGKPVIAVGSVGLSRSYLNAQFERGKKAGAGTTGTMAVADGLHAGDFDLVAVGRALLSDAHWARKVRENRPGDIDFAQ